MNNGHLDIPDRAKIVFSLTPENLRYARSDKTDSRPLMTLLQKAGSKVTIGSTNRSAREGNRSLLQIQDGYYQEKDAELEVVLHPNRKRNQPFIELTEEGGILSGKLLINAQGSNYIAGDEYTIVVSNLTCVDAENLQEVKVVGDLAGKLNVEVVEQDLSNPKELKIRVKETMLFDEIKEEGNEEEGYFDYLRSLPIQSQTPIADFLSDIGSVYSSSDMVQIVPRLLPSLYTSLSWMSLDTGRTVLDGIELFSNCLYEGGCKGKEQDGRFWSQASSWLTDYDPLQSMLGFRSTNGTFSLGYEHCIVSGLVLGFFGSYTHNYVNWKEHFGKGNLNTLQFGLYANYCREHVYANAAIGSGVSFYDMHRFTKVNGASGTLEDVGVEATFQGIPALAQIKIGGKGEIGPSLVLSPELLVSYHFLYRGSFREEGPVCTVWQLSSMHSHMLHGDLGLVLSKSVNVKQVRFLLFSGISYVANLPLGSGSYRASLADFSEQMTFTSPNRVRSRVAPKVGLKGVSLANGVSFELRYQGQFGSGQDYHNATAVLEAQF